MREIKFRGKRVDNGEWIYGSLINNAFTKSESKENCIYIFDNDKFPFDCFEDIGENLDDYEVIPETVGQLTGLPDKNGKQIFEGDILQGYENGKKVGVDSVVFRDGAFTLNNTPATLLSYCYLLSKNQCEVIGNIHSNPELL